MYSSWKSIYIYIPATKIIEKKQNTKHKGLESGNFNFLYPAKNILIILKVPVPAIVKKFSDAPVSTIRTPPPNDAT